MGRRQDCGATLRTGNDEADSRDLIDLAMMTGNGRIPPAALEKAKAHIERPGRLARCMANLQITQPPALVLDRIRKLRTAPAAKSRSRA